MNSHWLRSVLGVVALLGLADCGCGVGADPGGARSSAGVVQADGSVHFTAIAPGTVESFPIPVRESADTTETIQSASVTGSAADSFQILSQFPIDVPKGQDVTVEVQFNPVAAGTFVAALMLQTAKMGTSQVLLFGTSTP